MSNSRTALVTGANRGIGFETARQLAKKGFQVILTSRDKEKGKKAVDKLKEEGLEVLYHQLDVTKEESIHEAAEYVKNELENLDILINNAAVHYDSDQQASDANLNIVEEALDTNLLGPWRVCKAFVPIMKKNKYGRIVNVSSQSGSIQSMGASTPAYGVSKAALNAFTVKLANELEGSGILVNAIGPGWVETDMGGSAAPRSPKEGAESIIWGATLPDDGPTGGFFRDGEKLPW